MVARAVVNIYPPIPNVQMEGATVHMKMDNSQALSAYLTHKSRKYKLLIILA